MKIAELLKEDRISLNLKASNKDDAIKEIGSLLTNAKEITAHQLFLKHVFEREALNTTGIGNHIAIPHARTEAVNDFIVAFGRSKQGIEFSSLDNKPAKLIFLMGTPKKKALNNYLMILAHLTRLLQKEDFRKALLDAPSPKEIIDAFRKIEQ
jgi:fructose-specific phosphotransferase system IIA component